MLIKQLDPKKVRGNSLQYLFAVGKEGTKGTLTIGLTWWMQLSDSFVVYKD